VQVKHQTKPLPHMFVKLPFLTSKLICSLTGKLKNQGKNAVEEALHLCKVCDILKQCVEDIENLIFKLSADLTSMMDAERCLEEAHTAL
jgi:hypothetical protein